MALLLITRGFKPQIWVDALKKHEADLDIRIWPDVGNPKDINFALVWRYPPGELCKYPNLKCIASMGAGVDHIFSDPDLPNVPIVRVVDKQLMNHMTQFAVWAALDHIRMGDKYKSQQKDAYWKVHLLDPNSGIGIMGAGQMGKDAAEAFVHLGFEVYTWSRTSKNIEGVKSFYGDDGLKPFLNKCDILICELPLTPQTHNILNQENLNQLPKGAYVINIARGGHVNDEDLIEALDCGHVSGALLDTFRDEPLPAEHPFWNHPKIKVTPHVASITDPNVVAKQVIENYQRMQRGEPLSNQVDPSQGY